MSEETNAAVAHDFFAAVNAHDLDAAEQLLDPGFVFHVPRRSPIDRQGWRHWFATFLRGFPDLHIHEEDVIDGGDQVAVRWTLHGTHQGMFQSMPPTGREVTTPGVSILRITGGTIAQGWILLDELGLLEQLGVILVRGQPFPE